jgi:hypothetical protein
LTYSSQEYTDSVISAGLHFFRLLPVFLIGYLPEQPADSDPSLAADLFNCKTDLEITLTTLNAYSSPDGK